MEKPRHLAGLTVLFVFIAAMAMGANTLYIGPSGGYNVDNWPSNSYWSAGVPSGADNAYVPSGIVASASGDAGISAYTGSLTISNNAELACGASVGSESIKIRGTPGSTIIYLYTNATMNLRPGNLDYVMPEMQLLGPGVRFSMTRSTVQSSRPDFDYTIGGAYDITFQGKGGCIGDLNASNSFTHLIADPQYGASFTLNANVPGSLGNGDVTIKDDPSTGIRCAELVINATNTMSDTCTLTINGPLSTDRITMNGDNTIADLFLDNVRQDAGTYGRVGNTNVDYPCVWFLGDGILTVTGPSLSYWDTNSTTTGAGGASPAGTWDAANTYWSTSAVGTAATAAWNPGDLATFAAGTDATSNYTVTVSGTQDISGIYFEEGNVTLTGGTLEMTAKSYFNVADGLTITNSCVVTNDATAWTFIKSGDGTLVPTAANTYTGPTRIEGGTMVVSNLANAGTASHIGSYPSTDQDGLELAGGGTLKYTGGDVTLDRGIHLEGDATIDVAADDVTLRFATSECSEVQGTLTVTGGSNSTLVVDEFILTKGVGVTLKPVDISMSIGSVGGASPYPYASPPLTLSGSTTGNVITGFIYDRIDTSRDVRLFKRGSSTWTISGEIDNIDGELEIYEGTLVLSGDNHYNTTLLKGGTLIIETNAVVGSDSALGNGGNGVHLEIGVDNGGVDAAFLIGGPYDMARKLKLNTDNTADTGTRTITIGGNTADESSFSHTIWLGDYQDNSLVAWGLNLTAASGGTVTFNAAILEPYSNALITARYPIRKVGEGTVVFAGTNDYQADTYVDAGTLSLAIDGTLDNGSTLYITNGAIVDLASGVNQTVADLYLGGLQSFHGYTYGSSFSTADFKLDEWFTGTGVVTVAGARDGLCSITNAAATGVGETSVTFNAILTVTNISTDVYVHWGETDGTNNYGAWSNSAPVGTWTSVINKAISFTTNGLSGDTTYYYTFRATNAAQNIWASPSTNFATLASVEVNNSTGATSESDVSATLRGRLTNGSVAAAWICWGDDDGGFASTANWDNVVSMGTVTEAADFTTLAEGLEPNVTYWYRCFATNELSEDWSDTPQSFSGVPINPGNGGSVAIYTHTVREEDAINPEANDDPYDLTWNTIVRQSAEYELDYSGRVNVTVDPGHHLVMHSGRYSTGINGSGRREVHHYILVDGEPQAIGWASSYADNWQDRQDNIHCGGGIIYLASTSTVSIQACRTDSQSNDDVDRIANASGLQLLKLNETWDYCRLSKSAAQVGPTNTTYVDVEYGTQDEVDSGSFVHTNGTGDIVLKEPGHYLVFANTYIFEDGDNQNIRQQLTLNGTLVEGSWTEQHIKNDADCDEGAATLGMIIETSSSNAVLNVEVSMRENCVVPTFIMPDKTAVTIAKLPADGDYIRLHNSNVNTITNFNAPSALAMDWDTVDELDSGGFTGTYSPSNSVITTTADADYLFLATLCDQNCGDATYLQRWSTNGVSDPIAYAVGGDCTQGGEGGGFSGIIIGMQSNSTIEGISESVSYPTSTTVMNGQSAGLWGMRLESVFRPPEGEIANLAPTNVTGSSAALNGALLSPDTNYTVYVHFGTSDGGTNIGSWDAYYEVGDYGNVASTNISYVKGALDVNTTYYYTFRGSNDSNVIWASPSWSFVTTAPLGSGNLFILY